MSSLSPTPPASAPSMVTALGPLGSAVTTLVVSGATAVVTLVVNGLVAKGFVSSDDAPKIITGGVALLLGFALGAYKALASRMGAKITAVAGVKGITVVAPVDIAKSAEHVADNSVVTPTEAAVQFSAVLPRVVTATANQ